MVMALGKLESIWLLGGAGWLRTRAWSSYHRTCVNSWAAQNL